MPTSSSTSSIHLTPRSCRRPNRDDEQRSTMRPQQELEKASNGSEPKKEKVVKYRECRKNHAASIGGYAVDGCREFMASGEEGTSAALRCAACSCHRSFHKREVESEVSCDCSSNSTSRR